MRDDGRQTLLERAAALRVLKTLREYFFPSPIRDAPALRAFLSSQASYLSQRTILEFTRNTLAYAKQHWQFEPAYQEATRICGWESFGAILEDMAVCAEGHLRPVAAARLPALADALQAACAEILNGYQAEAKRPHGWADRIASIGRRLQKAQLADRARPAIVAKVGTKHVFAHMPVYSQNKAGDYAVVENALMFGLTAFADKLHRLVEPEPVVADLLRHSAPRR
jgi:hypothetical protein